MTALPLSTTDSLPGTETTGLVGLVTSHVVAGTGLFLDLAAGLSDVFGGRSQSYQRQLAEIADEAAEELWTTARRRGAQGVVGVRIDFSEISGKGKQLLMVSATGTGVKTRALGGAQHQVVDEVSSSTVLHELVIQEYLDADGPIRPTADTWAKLMEVADARLIPIALQLINRDDRRGILPREAVVKGPSTTAAIEFLDSIDREDARQKIVQLLTVERDISFRFLVMAARELRLGEYGMALSLLESDDIWSRKAGFALIAAPKNSYSATDAVAMRDASRLLRGAFPQVALSEEKRGAFGKSVTVTCGLCGSEFDGNLCGACSADDRGLFPEEKRPESVADFLERRAQIVEAALSL